MEIISRIAPYFCLFQKFYCALYQNCRYARQKQKAASPRNKNKEAISQRPSGLSLLQLWRPSGAALHALHGPH